jgi:hypothetical protein
VCWKPCSSCWSFHLLREEFLSAPIHSPPLWFAVSVLQRLTPAAAAAGRGGEGELLSRPRVCEPELDPDRHRRGGGSSCRRRMRGGELLPPLVLHFIIFDVAIAVYPCCNNVLDMLQLVTFMV